MMPLLALKAHYDGQAVVFDEPLHDNAARLAAFQSLFGVMRGKLNSSNEFMARKAEEKALEQKIHAGKTEFGGILQ